MPEIWLVSHWFCDSAHRNLAIVTIHIFSPLNTYSQWDKKNLHSHCYRTIIISISYIEWCFFFYQSSQNTVLTWLWLCLLGRFCHNEVFLQYVCLLLNVSFSQSCYEGSPCQRSCVVVLVVSSQPFTEEVVCRVSIMLYSSNDVMGKI